MKIVIAYALCIIGGGILGIAGLTAGIGGPMTIRGFFGTALAAVFILVGLAVALAVGLRLRF